MSRKQLDQQNNKAHRSPGHVRVDAQFMIDLIEHLYKIGQIEEKYSEEEKQKLREKYR